MSDGMRILLLLSRFKKKASSCPIFIRNRARKTEFEKEESTSFFLNLTNNKRGELQCFLQD